jgi:hypothetical protein
MYCWPDLQPRHVDVCKLQVSVFGGEYSLFLNVLFCPVAQTLSPLHFNVYSWCDTVRDIYRIADGTRCVNDSSFVCPQAFSKKIS